MFLNRVPPNNLEAERTALGGILVDNKNLSAILAHISPGDLYAEAHVKILERMIALAGRQAPVDLVSLGEECQRAGVLAEVGGAAYLASLMDGVPRSLNVEYYARIIKEKSLLRRLITSSTRIIGECYDQHEEAGEILGRAHAGIGELAAQGTNGRHPANIVEALRTGAQLQELDLTISYAVDKLAPDRALILFHGRGGLGKTWVGLQLARAVSLGEEVFGLATKKRPVVYIDFENPLSIMVERVRLLDVREVLFWTPATTPRPPKLDSDDWVLYKSLPPGALLIIDSLRSSYSGDENSSRDMAVVMGRLLELRDHGFTLLVNHHTPKGNERTYKGSTAISDLVDHVLAFHKVRAQSLEEIDDDLGPAPGDTFYLGTRDKTRFEPFKLFLTFLEGGGFGVAEDPDGDELSEIRDFMRSQGDGLTQTDLWKWAKSELGKGNRAKFFSLLRKGEVAQLWTSRREGRRRVYGSI